MKNLLLTTFLAFSVALSAQYSLPTASPRQKIEQQFSLSKITVDYGRPGVKGRKIFGELVPFGQVWRAGANSSTKISFGQNVLFGGKPVPAGTYGLFIQPTENSWKVILNKDSQNWGTQYDSKLDFADVTVPTARLGEKQEWFEITVQPVDDNSAELVFKWDYTKVVVPVKTVSAEVTSKISEKLKEIRQIERDAAKK